MWPYASTTCSVSGSICQSLQFEIDSDDNSVVGEGEGKAGAYPRGFWGSGPRGHLRGAKKKNEEERGKGKKREQRRRKKRTRKGEKEWRGTKKRKD